MVVLNVLDFINVRKESSVQFFSCAVLCYNTYYFEHVQNVFRCSVVQMVLLARSHIIVNAVNSFQVTDNILAIHSSAFFFYSNFYSQKDLTPHPVRLVLALLDAIFAFQSCFRVIFSNRAVHNDTTDTCSAELVLASAHHNFLSL